MSYNLKCIQAENLETQNACFDVRRQVFVEEQGVDLSLEQDGKDSEAEHFCALVETTVAGVCRVRYMGSAAKIERMAVLKPYRGKGVGRVLMKHVLREIEKKGHVHLFRLSAQADAVPFYEKLGFVTRGQEYLDAGIPHYDMIRET